MSTIEGEINFNILYISPYFVNQILKNKSLLTIIYKILPIGYYLVRF